MRLSAVFTIISLVSAALFGAACTTSGGGTTKSFYYYPPVNYNPTAGMSPNLSEGLLTGVPSSAPFKP